MKQMGGVSSKPAFAMAAKKPTVTLGTKPSFAIKKKAQAVDDLLESEMNIVDNNTYASPDRVKQPPSVAYSAYKDVDQDEEREKAPMFTPALDRKDMSGSTIKKGPTMFMKPKLPTKKKF
jgi:hypothetical protein